MALNIPVAMQGVLLKSSDADIFQIIESAITVAAKRCPQEFFARRDQIAQLLFSPPTAFIAFDPFFGKSDCTTVGSCVSKNQVSAAETKDGNGCNGDNKKRRHVIKIILSVLKKQRESKKPDQVLVQESTTTTGIDASRNIQDAKKPQILVQESITTTGIDAARKVRDAKKPQVLVRETTTKTGTDVAIRKVQEPVCKGQGDGRCKRGLDEDVLFQRKLEATQKKIQERYQQCQDAKTKKRIRVIELQDVPKPPTDN